MTIADLDNTVTEIMAAARRLAAPKGETMRAPSIAEIAAHNERAGGYYFSRETLRFFGQTRKDFRSRYLPDGRIIVYSRAHRGWNIGGGVVSLAVYDPETGLTHSPADADEIKAVL